MPACKLVETAAEKVLSLAEEAVGPDQFEKYPDVAFANLASMGDFAKRAATGGFGVNGQREFIHLRTNFSLDPEGDYFASQRTDQERSLLGAITRPNDFDRVSSVQIYPHMIADTTAPWLAKFASKILKVPSARYSLHLADPWKASR